MARLHFPPIVPSVVVTALSVVGCLSSATALGQPAAGASAAPPAVPTTGASDTKSAKPAWTLQIDPLTVLLGFVHVQIERRVHNHLSLYLGPSFHLFNAPGQAQDPYRGYGGEMGIRYFYAGHAPEGWWSQVRGVAAYLETTDDTQLSSFGGYVSVLSGYTGIVDDWLVLAAGLGVQYFDYRVGDYGLFGVLPAAHTTVGAAF